jgi:hypothetical protein
LATVFLTTLVYDAVFLLTIQITGQNVAWLPTLVRISLPSALLNAALALPVYWIMRGISRRFVEEEMEV